MEELNLKDAISQVKKYNKMEPSTDVNPESEKNIVVGFSQLGAESDWSKFRAWCEICI